MEAYRRAKEFEEKQQYDHALEALLLSLREPKKTNPKRESAIKDVAAILHKLGSTQRAIEFLYDHRFEMANVPQFLNFTANLMFQFEPRPDDAYPRSLVLKPTYFFARMMTLIECEALVFEMFDQHRFKIESVEIIPGDDRTIGVIFETHSSARKAAVHWSKKNMTSIVGITWPDNVPIDLVDKKDLARTSTGKELTADVNGITSDGPETGPNIHECMPETVGLNADVDTSVTESATDSLKIAFGDTELTSVNVASKDEAQTLIAETAGEWHITYGNAALDVADDELRLPNSLAHTFDAAKLPPRMERVVFLDAEDLPESKGLGSCASSYPTELTADNDACPKSVRFPTCTELTADSEACPKSVRFPTCTELTADNDACSKSVRFAHAPTPCARLTVDSEACLKSVRFVHAPTPCARLTIDSDACPKSVRFAHAPTPCAKLTAADETSSKSVRFVRSPTPCVELTADNETSPKAVRFVRSPTPCAELTAGNETNPKSVRFVRSPTPCVELTADNETSPKSLRFVRSPTPFIELTADNETHPKAVRFAHAPTPCARETALRKKAVRFVRSPTPHAKQSPTNKTRSKTARFGQPSTPCAKLTPGGGTFSSTRPSTKLADGRETRTSAHFSHDPSDLENRAWNCGTQQKTDAWNWEDCPARTRHSKKGWSDWRWQEWHDAPQDLYCGNDEWAEDWYSGEWDSKKPRFRDKLRWRKLRSTPG